MISGPSGRWRLDLDFTRCAAGATARAQGCERPRSAASGAQPAYIQLRPVAALRTKHADPVLIAAAVLECEDRDRTAQAA
jgi:hypothetical protein